MGEKDCYKGMCEWAPMIFLPTEDATPQMNTTLLCTSGTGIKIRKRNFEEEEKQGAHCQWNSATYRTRFQWCLLSEFQIFAYISPQRISFVEWPQFNCNAACTEGMIVHPPHAITIILEVYYLDYDICGQLRSGHESMIATCHSLSWWRTRSKNFPSASGCGLVWL